VTRHGHISSTSRTAYGRLLEIVPFEQLVKDGVERYVSSIERYVTSMERYERVASGEEDDE
jgi:hypothetical protein